MDDDDKQAFLKRQKALADFGDFALQSEDLGAVLTEACRLVGEAMGTDRAKVLEIEEGGQSLLVRAGVGWHPGVVGRLRLPMNERSSETYSIEQKHPVITRDIAEEERFEVPEFMRQAGVVALANVPILLPGGRAYGLLQVDDTRPRDFGEDDTQFLRTYATILGPVIDRLFKLGELRSAEQRFRLTVEEARDYAIFTTDPDDRITDWLPGAAAVFGWSPEEAIGRPGAILFTPEDREAGEDRKEVETARERGVAPDVRWHVRKDGSRVFIEGSVRALRDGGGAVAGFLKIGQDVTERREWLDRQQVLLGELQHRTRNLLGVVRRIADQTLRSSADLGEFGPRFRERLSALARAQDLLSRLNDGERVAFDELIEGELSAHGGQGGRVELDGPKGVALRSGTVQILALALARALHQRPEIRRAGPAGGPAARPLGIGAGGRPALAARGLARERGGDAAARRRAPGGRHGPRADRARLALPAARKDELRPGGGRRTLHDRAARVRQGRGAGGRPWLSAACGTAASWWSRTSTTWPPNWKRNWARRARSWWGLRPRSRTRSR